MASQTQSAAHQRIATKLHEQIPFDTLIQEEGLDAIENTLREMRGLRDKLHQFHKLASRRSQQYHSVVREIRQRGDAYAELLPVLERDEGAHDNISQGLANVLIGSTGKFELYEIRLRSFLAETR